MDSVHDRAGEHALEIIAGDADAAAFAGLHAFDHRVRLVTVFAGDLGDTFPGGLLDAGMTAQRLRHRRFGDAADFADFLH